MVQGNPLKDAEKEYILNHIDAEFPSQIAKDLKRNPATIKQFLKNIN